jgi:outer membrane protein OmpA-like peptidoglycan-associated protein
VRLEFKDGVLQAAGSAPVEWIETAMRVAPFVPGVARFEATPVIEAALTELTAAIENATPMFVKGSTAFTAEGEGIVGDQRARLASLDALGRAARRQFTVELVGEADADGLPESNLPLSQRRAALVLSLLEAQRLERVTLTATGIGSRSAASPAEDEANKQRNRRVSFRVNRAVDQR